MSNPENKNAAVSKRDSALPFSSNHKQKAAYEAGKMAGRVVFVYVVVAAAWILVSDRMLAWVVQDSQLRVTISVAKGWLFVSVTAALLFYLLRREGYSWSKERAARADAEMALRIQTERQQLLLEASRLAFEASEREHDLSVALMKVMGPHLGADMCFHFRLSEDGKELELIAAIGLPPRHSTEFQSLGLSKSFSGRAVVERRTVVADETEVLEKEEGTLSRLLGIRAVVALPLMARDGRVLGALSFGSRTKARYLPGEVASLEIMCRIVSLATERMRAMAELRDSEARYRLLAENTADVIWVLDIAKERIVYVSPSVEKLCGFTPEEVLQQTMAESLAPASYDMVSNVLPERLAGFAAGDPGSVTQTHEVEQTCKDGSTVWTEVVTTLIRTPSGLQILGVSRNISERRKMEQRIRAQEALLRETTALAQVGGWEFDPISQVGSWTEETARIHDLEPESEINVSKGLSFYTPSSRKVIEAAVKEAVQHGTPYDLELEIVSAEGRNKWIRTTAHPILENGRVVRVRGTFQDISLKKRSELFADGQKQVLEMIVNGRPLPETLQALVKLTEAQCDGMLCSVLLLDSTGTRLFDGSSPGLPAEFRTAINGISIGPAVGSCGTAAFRKAGVFVEDIDADPLWKDFRGLAQRHGLKACWSTPIFGDQREVLGTFAVYFRTPKKADPDIMRMVELSTHTASIALNRARIEQALRASEAQFRAVVESATDGIFIQTRRRFAYVNQATARMLGAQSVDYLLGREVLDFVHADSVEKVRERIRLLNEAQRVAPLAVIRFVRLDGSVIDVEVSGVPFVFQGETGALVFARDVTERRSAEERLRFQQAILKETGHIAKVGGWSLDPVTGECFWTEEVAHIHELDTNVPVTRDLALQFYESKSRHRLRDAIDRAIQHGTPYDLELRLITARGNRRWIRTIGHPVVEEGRVVRLRGSFQDITERKQAEAALRESETRFRQVVENIEEVFWVTDPDKRSVIYVSPAYEKVWGKSAESVLENPESWLDSIHEEDRSRVRAAALRQADGNYSEIYRICRPDGKIRWIQDRAFPVRDEAGKVCRIVGTATDITEHRNLEVQFRQAQKMEAIGTLAGGIAHDFNNILGAIQGYSDLAKLETLGPMAKSSLDEISRACKRAGDLVRQILTFSRQHEYKRLPLQLWRVVDEAIRLLRAAIPATIDFDVALDKNAPTVLADATQIHQVVMNLCTNAAHAMGGKTGVLGVRLELLNADWEFVKAHPGSRLGRYTMLTVSDNGMGMDQATLDRIYEPFFTTKAPGEGSGLGLSVVHGIVQNHDAMISVQSTPGTGTTFRLYFPAYEGVEQSVSADLDNIPRGNGERVLVVDDEAQLTRMTSTILNKLGYHAEVAHTPQEALNRLRDSRGDFQLVLTDLTMPGMTGVDLANAIAATFPRIAVVMMTGYFSRQNHDLIESAGIKHVLLKPIDMRSLAETVRRVLNRTEASLPA